MARRRTSAIEDIIAIASRLPWCLGLLLAILSFVALHLIANIQPPQPSGLENLGGAVRTQMFVTFATFGQFILPAAFGLGSLLSLFKVRSQKRRYEVVKAKPAPDALFEMTWQQFEGLVAEFFRRRGYEVKKTGGEGPDGGVDLVLTKGNDKYLVQCKQWKAYKVGVQTVRELYGVMAASGAAGGFVITAGEFTEDAKKFAQGLNIQLFDGSRLHQMIREAKQRPEAEVKPSTAPGKTTAPVCPKCGKDMVKRVARQGEPGRQGILGMFGVSRMPADGFDYLMQ